MSIDRANNKLVFKFFEDLQIVCSFKVNNFFERFKDIKLLLNAAGKDLYFNKILAFIFLSIPAFLSAVVCLIGFLILDVFIGIELVIQLIKKIFCGREKNVERFVVIVFERIKFYFKSRNKKIKIYKKFLNVFGLFFIFLISSTVYCLIVSVRRIFDFLIWINKVIGNLTDKVTWLISFILKIPSSLYLFELKQKMADKIEIDLEENEDSDKTNKEKKGFESDDKFDNEDDDLFDDVFLDKSKYKDIKDIVSDKTKISFPLSKNQMNLPLSCPKRSSEEEASFFDLKNTDISQKKMALMKKVLGTEKEIVKEVIQENMDKVLRATDKAGVKKEISKVHVEKKLIKEIIFLSNKSIRKAQGVEQISIPNLKESTKKQKVVGKAKYRIQEIVALSELEASKKRVKRKDELC